MVSDQHDPVPADLTRTPRPARLPEDQSRVRHTASRIRRHVAWARRDGIARLVEEDRLDPRERVGEALRRRAWRLRNPVAAGSARAVFVVGVQRSGTNMVVRSFEASPEFETHNENDRAVFERFQLRSDDLVRTTIERSRHRFVLLKPLCDSHRTDRLLDGLGLSVAPRALWVFRSVDGRVRSAVAKFGDVNRRILTEIADGTAESRWQAQRLPASTRELIAAVEPRNLSAESAAALFWFARNQLFFEQGLHRRDDVMAVSYDTFVQAPEATMRPMCAFLGVGYDDRLVAHVTQRGAATAAPLDLHPDVRAACDDLGRRLGDVAAEHRRRSPR